MLIISAVYNNIKIFLYDSKRYIFEVFHDYPDNGKNQSQTFPRVNTVLSVLVSHDGVGKHDKNTGTSY